MKKYDSLLIEHDVITIRKFKLDEEFRESLLNFKLLSINLDMFSASKKGILDTVNFAECP